MLCSWGYLDVSWSNLETTITCLPDLNSEFTIYAPIPTCDGRKYFVNDGNNTPNISNLPIVIHPVSFAAHTVSPANPENVTVNLFDYWVKTENPTVESGGDILDKSDIHYHEEGGEGALGDKPTGYSTEKDWDLGINQKHLLLFGDGLIHAGLWNKGAGENCRYGKQYAGMEGIVRNVLTENGYPEINLDLANVVLNGDKSIRYTLIKDYLLTGDHKEEKDSKGDGYTYDSSDIQNLSNTVINTWGGDINGTESLQYLFEPANGDFKKAYTDVTGLFQLDEYGYYYYNMRDNFAELSQEGGKNHFILYDAPATTRTDGDNSIGNFFPFNTGDEVFNGLDETGELTSSVDCARNSMNHHLGMTVDVDFRQPANGVINTGKGQQNMSFQFSGDDDVWVFIDGVLVLDLGGIHSELYGTIDFATGDVYIGRSFTTHGIPDNPAAPEHMVNHTTLKELYEIAGKADKMQWTGDTYASNTSHTLKMFYLERGNYDSSIALRFNLQPLLYQRIEKVDQNGEALQGVEFELYPAEKNKDKDGIQCLYTDGNQKGQTFYVTPVYTKDPLVTLRTDEDGAAEFELEDGGHFNFADRGDQYYVLKETHAPDGYRTQPVDIVLHYDTKTATLSVANRWTTGAYACSVVNVTSAKTGDAAKNDGLEDGLVVAVPLLRKDTVEGSSWQALYGGNLAGFKSVTAVGTDINQLNPEAVLQAAVEQAKATGTAGWYLDWDSSNQRLQGTLFDLPGLATRYLLNNPENGDMHMAYMLISGLEGGNAEERYAALARTTPTSYKLLEVNQFNRDFRSMIYIPNERRELWVLKVDQDGKPLKEAEFGLYDNERCDGTPVASGATDDKGMLIFSPTGQENGTGHTKMDWADSSTETRYYLQEIEAPEGYTQNTTKIPVVVGSYSIYADAGDADDGVTVMAGVGKLTQTMRQYAEGNDVDITLQDITAFMQTQPGGNGFSLTGWKDAVLEGTNILRSMNLHFGKNAEVDYGLHDEDGGKNFKPFFVTDTGFIRARVQQMALNYKYENPNEGVNRDVLGDTDLTNLFSLLNVVVVTDKTIADTNTGKLTISKKVTGSNLTPADYTKNFKFKVELWKVEIGADGQTHDVPDDESYYYFYGNDKSGHIQSGGELVLRHDDSVTILGLPANTKYKVTEVVEGDRVWHVSPSSTIEGTVITNGDHKAEFVNSTDKSSVEEPDSGSLTIRKTVTGESVMDDDRKIQFEFTVNLKDSAGNPLSESYSYTGSKSGNIKNGGTITLCDGESVTITGLPEGTAYEVKEAAVEGWEKQSPEKDPSGTILADKVSEVNFINRKAGTTEPETGSLTIHKTVQGGGLTDADRAQSFKFTVFLKDAGGTELTGTYPFKYSGENGATGVVSSGKTEITLHDGQSVTITGLPLNTNYTVTEDVEKGWEIAETSGISGTITSGEAEASFINQKNGAPPTGNGNLQITKRVTGDNLTSADRAKKFSFTVTLLKDGKPLDGSFEYTDEAGGKLGDIITGGSITLCGGQSVMITGLPDGTLCIVAETAEAGWTADALEKQETVAVNSLKEIGFINTKAPDDPPPSPTPPPVTPPDDPRPPDDPPPVTPPDDPPPVTPPDDSTPPDDPPPATPPDDPPAPPPDTPDVPDVPDTPDTPDDRPTVLPDPNDPNSPDVITIWENDVPRTYRKVWDPEKEEWVYILDEDTPLANMDATPPTGDPSLTGLWALLNGLSLTGVAAVLTGFRRKKKDD